MGYHWKLSAEQRAEIVHSYCEGEPCEVIAKRFGISHTYVSVLAKKAGCAMRTNTHMHVMHRAARER